MIIDEEVYLAHHGVKGMRWGVRHPRDRSRDYSSPRIDSKTNKALTRERISIENQLKKDKETMGYDKAMKLFVDRRSKLSQKFQDASSAASKQKPQRTQFQKDQRRRAIVSGVAGTAAIALGVATILDASRGTRYHDIPHFNAGGTSFKFKTRPTNVPSRPSGPPLRVQNLNDYHALGGSAHHPQLAARRVLELNAGTPISSFSGFTNQVNQHLNRPYAPGQLLHPTSQDRMNEWLRR